MNRHWTIGINDRNDLVFMLAFLEKFRKYFTKDYRCFIAQCIQRNKYLAMDIISSDNYIDIISVARYLFIMKLENKLLELNLIYKAKLLIEDKKELTKVLNSISSPPYEIHLMSSLNPDQISSLRYELLDHLSEKIKKTESIHEILMYHQYVSKLSIPSISSWIHNYTYTFKKVQTLPDEMNALNIFTTKTYEDRLTEVKKLIYCKIEKSIHEFDIKLVSHIFDFNKDKHAMSNLLSLRILEIIHKTEINFENINQLCKSLLKYKHRINLVSETLLDYITRADLLKVYNLKRYGDTIQLYFMAKNKLDVNLLQPFFESLLFKEPKLSMFPHVNISDVVYQFNILIKNDTQNPLINRIYNRLVQNIAHTDRNFDSFLKDHYLLSRLVSQKNKLNLKLENTVDYSKLRESIRSFGQMDYANKSHNELQNQCRKYYTDLRIQLKCLGDIIVLSNLNINWLVVYSSMCVEMCQIVEKLSKFGIELTRIDHSFNDIFIHLDIAFMLKGDDKPSKLFRSNLAYLERFNNKKYSMIIKSFANSEEKTLTLIIYCMSLFNMNIINKKALKDLFPENSTLNDLLYQIRVETNNNQYLAEMYSKALYLINMDAYFKNINSIPHFFKSMDSNVTHNIPEEINKGK